MILIPLDPIPAQELQVTLDDQPCTLTIYQRGHRLFADLECDSEVVFQGRLCLDRQGIKQFKSNAFDGELYFRDSKGNSAPQYDELGDRYELYFLPEGDELPEGF